MYTVSSFRRCPKLKIVACNLLLIGKLIPDQLYKLVIIIIFSSTKFITSATFKINVIFIFVMIQAVTGLAQYNIYK